MTSEEIVGIIDAAFASPYPGDAFLVGSSDGCEPQEEAGAFAGITDWRTLTPGFLDGHYTALGFLSEAGLRFFLPAYLVADLRGTLMTAEPAFHLVHGFHELLVDTTGSDGAPIHHRSGGRVLLGPRREPSARGVPRVDRSALQRRSLDPGPDRDRRRPRRPRIAG